MQLHQSYGLMELGHLLTMMILCFCTDVVVFLHQFILLLVTLSLFLLYLHLYASVHCHQLVFVFLA